MAKIILPLQFLGSPVQPVLWPYIRPVWWPYIQPVLWPYIQHVWWPYIQPVWLCCHYIGPVCIQPDCVSRQETIRRNTFVGSLYKKKDHLSKFVMYTLN